MNIIDVTENEKKAYNALIHHPLQSYEWGEFRKKTQTKVIRKAFIANDKLVSGFQLTIHNILHTPWTIGYLPKGDLPDAMLVKALHTIGKQENCIFIQMEPDVELTHHSELVSESSSQSNQMRSHVQHDISLLGLRPAAHPLFTKHNFILDLDKSEEELLKTMHPKTRYNIRVAQKHGVEIIENNSDEAFETYWKLTEETTKRQNFYAHTKQYHALQWDTLNVAKHKDNALTSHLFFAKYQGEILAAWVLFVFQDTLYYPYGASSLKHREVMASNLIMWEAIRFGKQKGLKKFDMWGALGPNPDSKDSWYGFHRFKQGYGAQHVTFIGSFDLVIHPMRYQIYKVADKTRWTLLKLKR